MLQYYSSSDIYRLELNSEYLGISTLQLMENAGKAVADEISSKFATNSKVIIFGGTGRNGGDGMVAARHLSSMDYDVTFILVGKVKEIEDNSTKSNWKALKSMLVSVKIKDFSDNLKLEYDCDVVVDAMLGIGAKGILRQPFIEAVRQFNRLKGYKISIDIPTGMDSNNGKILGEAIKPDLILTFHGIKKGLAKRKTQSETKIISIGIPKEAELLVGPGDVKLVTKDRPPDSHKGDFGRLLIIGGSKMYSGAPALAGMAALRTGCDLVYIASPEKNAYAISSTSPNLITIKLVSEEFEVKNLKQLKPILKKTSAIILGPGLGLNPDTIEAVTELFTILNKIKKPTVIDADAIRILGLKKLKIDFPAVLTPHSGEFETLIGKKASMNLSSRIKEVNKTAKKLNAIIVLKGAADIISDGQNSRSNFTGNPGMTVGGTGDVLSGIIGGLIAQGNNCFNSSVASTFINGATGDLIFKEIGFHMVPTDLIDKIPKVMVDPMVHKNVKFD